MHAHKWGRVESIGRKHRQKVKVGGRERGNRKYGLEGKGSDLTTRAQTSTVGRGQTQRGGKVLPPARSEKSKVSSPVAAALGRL